MKLRILSVDLELDNEQITNAGFTDAPSFHDFDIVLIDPLGVTNFLGEQDHEYKHGVLTLDYDAKGTNEWVRKAINHRRKETKHFLSLGRLLVCILRCPHVAYVCSRRDDWPRPGEKENWVDNYGWFPLEGAADSMILILRESRGSKIDLTNPRHPFAPYFNTFNDDLHYEAYLDQAKTPYYFKDLHTIAETHGELPVGFGFKLQGGQVVFVPPVKEPDFKKLADILLSCVSATIGTVEETEPPPWLPDYKASVPGLLQLEKKIETQTAELQELTAQLDDLGEQKAEREKYLKLLYEQGKFQLEPVVRDAFSLLGFTVTDVEPSDGLLQSTEGTALLEVEGKDDSAIKIDKYRQLLDYVVDDERESQEAKKGILVGNGFRLKDPKERGEQFTQRAADGGAGSHFCLISTDTLFHLACQVLEKPDNAQLKSQIRTLLLATDGVFHL